MCGRYFWTDEAEDAFEEDFPDLAGEFLGMRAGDYTPGMRALALIGGGVGAAGGPAVQSKGAGIEYPVTGLRTEPLLWGFPGFDKGKLLINARAESVKDRPTFADSFAGRRCVLPAAGFYEWDRKKEKVIFTLWGRKQICDPDKRGQRLDVACTRPDAAHLIARRSRTMGQGCERGGRYFGKEIAAAQGRETV